MTKENPWATEAEKREKKTYEDVRQMKFSDNATHNIRLIPNKDTSKFPFFGYKQHWIPQNNSAKGRPITHGIEDKCVVCEYVGELWTEVNRLKEEEDMTDKSPEVVALVAKISEISGGAPRYDMNIFDRDEMEQKLDKNKKDDPKVIAPKRMTAPSSIWKTIFEYAKNPKWGNPSDIKKGYDFEIKTDGEGKRRNYTVVPDRNASPLSEEEIKAIDHGYDLEALKRPSTIKDIIEVLTTAKKPFDDILKMVDPDDIEDANIKKKPDDESVNTEELEKKDKEEEKPAKENTKSDKEEVTVQKDEPKEEQEGTDESDINEYECKGQFTADDKGCNAEDDPCPVKEKCIKFQPIYNKAVKLNIAVKPYSERTIELINADVEKAIKEAEEKEKKEKEEKEKAAKEAKKAEKETEKEDKKDEKKEDDKKEDEKSEGNGTTRRRRRNVPF